MVQNASNSPIESFAFRWVICFVICATASSFVHADESKLLNVQPATVKNGEISVFGIIREIPGYPFGEGTVLAVQVTASDSEATTESRRNHAGGPCVVCTTMHYFLVSEENEKEPEILYRTAPGPVTYIHIDNKEYMVGKVDLDWVGERPQLKKVTLLQTGFAPPLFKRRINIRFDEPVELNSQAEKIANMAMRDAFAYLRPITVPKVFPPEALPQSASDSE